MESLTVTANGCAAASQPVRSSAALRALGAGGLVGIVASVLLLAAGAAGAPGRYVPARSGGWPGWLAGPLAHLHLSLGQSGFQALTLTMCAGFALALAAARRLPAWAIAASIGACYVLLALGPPLISQDVLGYLGFARLGVLHGLDPYVHVAADAPTDAVFPFIGWPFQHSPYGPLFTLGSYALAPLGLAGGLWALKALAAIAALAAVGLTAAAASREGRSARAAAVFLGLNPVLLELALGGAHNDTIVIALLAAALALTAGRGGRTTGAIAALVIGVGVKASAGLALPFLVLSARRWRERARVAAVAAAGLALLAALALIAFGAHALGFLGVLREQQQLVAVHSIPAETARWVGLRGLPAWWRDLFLAGLAAAVALALWRTAARGEDWRAMTGWAMLALLLSTAWLLPWYAVWLLPLAAVADSRRLRAATLAFCAYAILVHLPLAAPLLSPSG